MKKIAFDPAVPLYTSDSRAWRIDQLTNVLDSLESTGKPTVIFVHGRGKEPNKSLRGGTFTDGMAVHKIELGYDVRVLMLNWDSAFKGFHFLDREVPLSHTEAASVALGQVLKELQKHQSAAPLSPKPALLVHSMGSIVIQKAILAGRWPDASGLFSCVLFSQPDADDVGHSVWLERLAQREKVFVTLSKDDHVLKRSTDARPKGTHALGLGAMDPLAVSATYVDLTCMGPMGQKDEDHEVFGKGAMNGQLYLCQFFTQALTGNRVTLDINFNVESVDRQVVYRLKSHFEPGAACLAKPTLPTE